MKITAKHRVLTIFLATLMLLALFPQAIAGGRILPPQETATVSDVSIAPTAGADRRRSTEPPQRAQFTDRPSRLNENERRILNHTREDEPRGVQGGRGVWEIADCGRVEVIVSFVTPSAVALRLMHEDDNRGVRTLSEQAFEQQALTAHENFRAQLSTINTAEAHSAYVQPLSALDMEIFAEHYRLFNGMLMRVPFEILTELAALPEVFSVTPNGRVSRPTPIAEETADAARFADGPATANFMQESLALFEVPYIHNELGLRGEGIRVAVLDTGVDYNHPRLYPYQCPTLGRIRGRNFTTANPYDIMDIDGHGTHVSGTIIALAPDVELWHYKVLDDDGGGTWAWLIAGVEAAHEDDMDVINLSLGGWVEDPFFAANVVVNTAALDGMVVVIAAGNGGAWGNYTIDSPGIAGLPITVGSGTAGGRNNLGDTISEFSGRGPLPRTNHIKPDILAPGHGIMSTMPGGNYAPDSGTSMAAPHVAGIAALLLNVYPDAAPYEVKARLMNTARPLARAYSPFEIGAGFLNPIAALTQDTFATVQHDVPLLNGDGQRGWVEATMASMSFGTVIRGQTESAPLTVTLHNPDGIWTPRIEFFGNHSGVAMQLVTSNTTGDNHSFTYRMTFAANVPNGQYSGNLIFTGGTQRITIPFGAVLTDPAIGFQTTFWPGDHMFDSNWWIEWYDFGDAVVGYTSHRERGFRIRNGGNVPIENITLSLAGESPGAFVLSQTTIPSLDLWDDAILSVAPRTGLSPGFYEAFVLISIQGFGIVHGIELFFGVDSQPRQELWLAGEDIFDWIDFPDNNTLYSFGTPRQGSQKLELHIEALNAGNQSTGTFTASLAGANPNSFEFATWDGHSWDLDTNGAGRPLSLPELGSFQWVDFYVIPAENIAVGTHEATVNISGASGVTRSFRVHVEVVPHYVIESIMPAGNIDLGTVWQDAAVRPFRWVDIIVPRGMIITEPLWVNLSGSGAAAFELSWQELGWAGSGVWDYFGVRQRQTAAPGNHSATVTITGSDGISESFNISMTVGVFDSPFSDVRPGDWFYSHVNFAAQNGLMNGTSATTFAPGVILSRGMVAAMLYNLSGRPAVNFVQAFTDVNAGAWYADAVIWAWSHGIVSGMGDGRFAPNSPMPREQFVTILFNYADAIGAVDWYGGWRDDPAWNQFPDRHQVSAWAQAALRWAVYNGIVSGSNGNLLPQGQTSRAECAAALRQFIDAFSSWFIH